MSKVHWYIEAETGFAILAPEGTLDEAQANEYMAMLERDIPPGIPCYLLLDGRKSVSATPGARNVLGTKWHDGPTYMAAFGLSVSARILLTLVQRGLEIKLPEFRGTVVADETAARAWLTERKRRYLAERGQT